MSRTGIALILTLGLSSSPARGDIVLSDGTFNNSDWSLTVFNDTTSNDTISATQETSGGNPGDYRLNSWSGSDSVGGFDAVSVYGSGFSYDPSTQGAITNLTLSVDVEGSSIDQGAALVVVQGGTVYRTAQIQAASTGVWETVSYSSLGDSSFVRVSPSGPTHPNFEAGGPITFGYDWFGDISDTSTTAASLGVDNFSVDISNAPASVPEPSALALSALLTAVGLGVRAYRRGE